MAVKINAPLTINRKTLRNRIIMPPMVCFNWADGEGKETVSRAEHYGRRARGGVGLIVVEATAITKAARLNPTELGLWSDAHLDQFSGIAKACRKENALVTVQLVHAGAKAVGPERFSASASSDGDKHVHALGMDQIEQVKADFVRAAVRARQAGLDGVEIHGAHGYLLNQFTSSESNRRSDAYGATLDGRIKLSLDVAREIRSAVGKDFIIGYRLGVNDPAFLEDAYLADRLQEAGVDFLNVSAGIGADGSGADAIKAPAGFPLPPIAWMGCALRKKVRLPVACVNGITKPSQAAYLLDNDLVDLVAVGRGLLADPAWVNKAIIGQPVNECARCSPGCHYREDGRNCPVDRAHR